MSKTKHCGHMVPPTIGYLRETEAWVAEERRKDFIKIVAVLLGLVALVAIVLGWPCDDSVCALAG
jgi:hypothetical protein